MELNDVMRSQAATRYYDDRDVPDKVLYDAVEKARFGPQGGNRQPVRFVFVRDQAKKRQLAEWYIQPWKAYYDAAMAGINSIEAHDEGHTQKATWIGHSKAEQALADANHFAEHFADHPVIAVVCGDLGATHPTDTELDRLSVVGGASIYPTAQNFCLALRDAGIATTFTTLLVAYEPQVKELLNIPEEFITACHIVAGYPAKPFPTKLNRLAPEEMAYIDTFGNPISAGS
ncbi:MULTISPECIES: nitroreductase family protein [unclassified Nocardioides]|uniref:nitroreductase family protein n=1 Tax=unclassified Nocardioides TaxID=2615069 RepID=UPI000056F773|nr:MULTISPECIES: nitroreductase family protein [unclassified Nocardioides]ABL80322.1 nitroreductase [Nocardioides sp. JS614]